MAASPKGKEERKVHLGSQGGLALGAETCRGGTRTGSSIWLNSNRPAKKHAYRSSAPSTSSYFVCAAAKD